MQKKLTVWTVVLVRILYYKKCWFSCGFLSGNLAIRPTLVKRLLTQAIPIWLNPLISYPKMSSFGNHWQRWRSLKKIVGRFQIFFYSYILDIPGVNCQLLNWNCFRRFRNENPKHKKYLFLSSLTKIQDYLTK